MARPTGRKREAARERPRPWLEKRGRAGLLFAALVLAGAILRLAFLDADPPETISWSQGPFTDGAVVVHDARNKALFGEWIVDYTKDLYLFPLSNVATYPVFRAAGVGRWQAALPSALFAVLSIVAVGIGLWRAAGRPTGLLWTGLASLSYFLIMFERIPIAEPAMIFLLSLSVLFFCAGGCRPWADAGSGFFAAAAPLFGKAHAFYFPVVLLLTYAVARSDDRRRPSRLSFAAAGIAAALLLWIVLLFLPHGEHIWTHLAHESFEKHVGGARGFISEIAQNLIGMGTYTRLWSRMPVVATLGFVGLAGLVARRRKAFAEEKPVVVLFYLWLVIGWASLALVRLPAPRYLSALAFPLIGLAIRPLAALHAGRPLVWRPPTTRTGILATLLFLLFAVYQPLSAYGAEILSALKGSSWGLGIYGLFVQEERYSELVFFCVVASLFVTLVLLALLALRRPAKPIRLLLTRRSGRAGAAALLALALLLSLGNWADWAIGRTHYLRDASRDLTDWIGPGARLMGSYAPTLGLDNDLAVYPYFGAIGEDDPFASHGITHVVIVSQGDHGEIRKKHPEIFEKWQMVLSYPIRCKYSDTMGIFRLPAEAGGKKIHHYEPGDFERAVDVAKEGRWEEALELLLRFRRDHPANADGHYLVGFMYNELGQPERAIKEMEKAIALRSERPYYYYKVGEIYGTLGRREEARRYLERANRLNPRDTDVRSALEEVGPGAH